MTPSGIEPATFRFVAQHLNHCATAVCSTISRNEDNVFLGKKRSSVVVEKVRKLKGIRGNRGRKTRLMLR